MILRWKCGSVYELTYTFDLSYTFDIHSSDDKQSEFMTF